MTLKSAMNTFAQKNIRRFSSGKNTISERRAWLLLPLCSTVLIYSLCYLTGKFAAGLSYEPAAILHDFLLQTLLAYIIYIFFRRKWAFVAFHLLFAGFLFLANAAKVAFHGVPLSPDDFFAVSDLFWILQKWQRALMVAFCVCVVMLMIIGTYWRRMAVGVMGIALSVMALNQEVAGSAFHQLSLWYGNSCWDMRSNLVKHGASLHTIMECLRYVSDSHEPPSMNAVNQAMANLEKLQIVAPENTGREDPSFQKRNLHMIILESFWDLTELSGAQFSRNPFDETFYQLWRETGFSKCLTPVYGGYTANSEFEVLTGFPVEENGVKFERRLRNDVPALPNYLAKHGYRTVASHPNVAGFWNRTNAYRRIGFQTYWSAEHFDLDDMNGDFLSDKSLYRQVLEKIEPALKSGAPIFNYILTYTGHVNYPLNEKRPYIIKLKSKYSDVHAYANTVYYKSKELADFIATLQKMDPDSLIVAFGDHAPFLGPNYGGYSESDILVHKMSDWTAKMLKSAYSTPLLIIDGRKGPVKTGILPLYRLPSLVLSLMGVEEKGILDFTVQPRNFKVRPLTGRQLVLDQHNDPIAFSLDENEKVPESIQQWHQQMLTLSEDLFVGRQYSLTFSSQKSMLTQHTQEKLPTPPSL